MEASPAHASWWLCSPSRTGFGLWRAVALGAATLPEVAERADLEPRATARALSRLVAGGLLDGGSGKGYRVRAEALQAAAIPPAPAAGEAPAGEPEDAVLRRFVDLRPACWPCRRRGASGWSCSTTWPGRRSPGRRYPEPVVNELLGRYHPDLHAMLRRYLVDDGFLARRDVPAPSGTATVKVYWRTGGSVDLPAPTSS